MKKSRVIILKSRKISGAPSESHLPLIRKLLSVGLKRLTDQEDGINAIGSLIPAGRKIGIKPNCLAGTMMSSSPIICRAIIDILFDAGNNKDDIVIWERSERELKRAGYDVNRKGDGVKVIANDTPGIGYSADFSVSGSVGSLLTNVLKEVVDYHINFPILKDHSIAGLSGGLKNLYAAVHNPNKYHDDNCTPFAADLYNIPEIRKKNKLTIMDCTRIQYNAGPAFNPRYAVESNMVLISDDPIALDVVALDILNDIRRKNGLGDLKSVGRYPGYLEIGADSEHKLGNFNRESIDRIEVII